MEKASLQGRRPAVRELDLTSPRFSGMIEDASGLDSRAGGAKGPPVRKVRAPQGKDNG